MAINIPENKNRNDYFKVFGLLDPSASIEDLKINIVELHNIVKKYWEPGNRTAEKAETLYKELASFYLQSFYKAVSKRSYEIEVPVNYTKQDLVKTIEKQKRYNVQKAKDLSKATLDYIAGLAGNFNEPAFGSVKDEDIAEFDPTLIPDYVSVVYRRYLDSAPSVIDFYNKEEKIMSSRFTEIRKGETKEFVDKIGKKTHITL